MVFLSIRGRAGVRWLGRKFDLFIQKFWHMLGKFQQPLNHRGPKVEVSLLTIQNSWSAAAI